MGVDDRFVGKGVVVEINSNLVTPSFQAVESVRSVTPVGEDNNVIDVTALTDLVSESQPGIPNVTAFTYQDYPNYNSASTEEDIREAQKNGTEVQYKITFINSKGTLVAEFNGFVQTHSYPQVTGTAALLRDVTVTKKGEVTWTYTPNP